MAPSPAPGLGVVQLRKGEFMDKMAKMANIAVMKTLPVVVDPILSGLHSVDASTVKNRYRDVAVAAAKGAVVIRHYSRPEFVILPAAEYVRLEKLRRAPLDALTEQFDGLVAKMQTPRSRKAVSALFGATAGQLGKAAVKAAAHAR